MADNFPLISEQTPLGWIGLGVMGQSMCGHLLNKGYRLTVFTRTRDKAEALLAHGAVWADSPAHVAAQSRVICTMVGFPADVRAVYLEKDGILEGAAAGSICVDFTTTEPTLAQLIDQQARPKNIATIDAPVSGGDVGARNATLSVMLGGEAAAIAAVRPLLEVVGKNIVHQGPAGAGQHTKMCNQIVIAGTMIGVCESLLYGYKAGLDLETMLSSIRSGAAGCWTLENLAPRILKGNFDPGFFVDHFLKDMEIALQEARRMNLSLPGLALVHQLYTATKALGHGRCGTHALMLALEQLSGLHVFGGKA